MIRCDPVEFELSPALTRAFLAHHRVCPRGFADDGRVVVAATDDAFRGALEDIARVYGRATIVETVAREELERLIERLTTRSDRSIELARADTSDDTRRGRSRPRESAARHPLREPARARRVRRVGERHPSRGHPQRTPRALSRRRRARFPRPSRRRVSQQAVVSRIKLLAELDIAERRRPQDGRIRVRLETRELDLRVSTVPTMHGESVVLRLLDHGGRPVTLADLGMSPGVLDSMTRLATRPHGMVLVTGPTGSGKTTTLYAALQQRERADGEDHHRRRSDRVSAARHHTDAGAPAVWRHVRRGAARDSPTRPRRGDDRRDARRRDGGDRGPGGHDGTSRAHDAAHQRRHQRHPAPARPRRPRLSRGRDARGCAGATTGAPCVRRLSRRDEPCRARRSQLVAGKPVARMHADSGRRVRGVSRNRVSRASGNLRAASSSTTNCATRSRRMRRARRCADWPIAWTWHRSAATAGQKAVQGLTTVEEVARVVQSRTPASRRARGAASRSSSCW